MTIGYVDRCGQSPARRRDGRRRVVCAVREIGLSVDGLAEGCLR